MKLASESRLEDRFKTIALDFIHTNGGLRQNRTENAFCTRYYINSDQLYIENYPRRTPKMAFNPGAMLKEDELYIFPRLIFEYHNYVSSIGLAKLNIEMAIQGQIPSPLSSKIILWPRNLWEFRGCEDARIYGDLNRTLMLYTGYGYLLRNEELVTTIVQAVADLDDQFIPRKRGFLTIKGEDERFLPGASKDSAILNTVGQLARMLIRPNIGGVEICWKASANLDDYTIEADSVSPALPFEEWEFKVGWSTNAVKISSNEYLVGWHGILKEDYSYRDGLAIVDGDGELLAISNYLLAPNGLAEEYGDRPLVIFGDGLLMYKEYLIWIGGVGDYAIGIFLAKAEEIMGKLRWLRP